MGGRDEWWTLGGRREWVCERRRWPMVGDHTLKRRPQGGRTNEHLRVFSSAHCTAGVQAWPYLCVQYVLVLVQRWRLVEQGSSPS